MKKCCISLLLHFFAFYAYGQTMHSVLFTNMEEQGRETDRKAELSNMINFCNAIASAIDFKHDLRVHSGREFTSTVMEKDISTLNVRSGDVVILYYAGHGCNWDDDDWPHMALLDRQYWQTTVFSKLKSACSKAKLTLCIASCCNMDSRGRTGSYEGDYSYIDKNKAKELFIGFNGRLSILTSSSIRGQYSYSWTGGSRLGSIYSISLRDEIYSAISGKTNKSLEWKNILEAAKNQTLYYTKDYKQPQQPQYKIYKNNDIPKATTPKISLNNSPKVEIQSVRIEHNVEIGGFKYMAIYLNFKAHYMTDHGGMVVAFFESPRGSAVKDTNGKYRTRGGNVCTYSDFGTHYTHSRFTDFKLLIPNSELHAARGTHTYYVKVSVYDNKSRKYIANSDYISFEITKK